jgi:hypothetical protein
MAGRYYAEDGRANDHTLAVRACEHVVTCNEAAVAVGAKWRHGYIIVLNG